MISGSEVVIGAGRFLIDYRRSITAPDIVRRYGRGNCVVLLY